MTIDIDDTLMSEAMRAAGTRTKKETVEVGLKLLLRLKAQEAIRTQRGKLQWDADLEAMRRDG